MTDDELHKLTLADAIRMVEQKTVTPETLVEAAVSRTERLNPEFRAFISIMKPEGGSPRRSPGGRLRGVPISVKDLYDTKGVRTTAGSKVFANRIPEEDATIVTKLKSADATIIGKNNMHEFA